MFTFCRVCCRYGFTAAIQLYSAFNYSCNGDEATLSDCEQITIAEAMNECVVDEVASAIAVECGEGQAEVSVSVQTGMQGMSLCPS